MSIYISASLLEDFISCNRKVYYRLDRSEDQVPQRGAIIGEIVHKAIELHWNNETVAHQYVTSQLEERLKNDKSALLHGEKCLKIFFKEFVGYLLPDDKIEIRFKVPWDKDIFIVGKIDRICISNVFDWKTTTTPLSNLSNSIQFILYDWAYNKVYNHKASGVYYGSLSTGKLIKYNEDSVSKTVLFNEVIPDVIDAIRSKNWVRSGIFRRACHGCFYSDTCLNEVRDVLGNSTYT